MGLARGAVWDRLFRKDFGNRDAENPESCEKISDLEFEAQALESELNTFEREG